jgi:hypothetical protein
MPNRLHVEDRVATCNPCGARKWRPEDAEVFRGASDVRLLADRDAPGFRHAIDVAVSLRSVGARARVFEAAVGKDMSDHLDAGRSLEELVEIDPEERLRALLSSEDPPISVDSVDAWENTVEFGAEEYVPEVPLEAFPESLASYAESLAESYQVAPDLVGAVLGMAAASVAGRAVVAVGDTHVEPLNLFVTPVAPPGERKLVIRETTFPLADEERRPCEAAAKEPIELADAPAIAAREQIGAVLIRSPQYGEVWVVLEGGSLLDELRAEEQARPNPRPVLRTNQIHRLRGKPEAAIRAVLNTLAVFPVTEICA